MGWVLMSERDLKPLLLLSTLFLGLAGCGEKTAVGEITDLVERCWKYVDTGDFPGRGLYWVRGTDPINTMEDRGANLRVIYGGTSLDDLVCGVTNHEVAWSPAERDAVFEAIEAAAPEWVAERNQIPASEVKRSNVTDGDYKRHVVFRSSTTGKAFLAIHEEEETGFVAVLTGRGAILK